MPATAAPCLLLNPDFRDRIDESGLQKNAISRVAGFPFYIQFYTTLREERVHATPLTVERLERVADAVGFPKDEIFLDEAAR